MDVDTARTIIYLSTLATVQVIVNAIQLECTKLSLTRMSEVSNSNRLSTIENASIWILINNRFYMAMPVVCHVNTNPALKTFGHEMMTVHHAQQVSDLKVSIHSKSCMTNLSDRVWNKAMA